MSMQNSKANGPRFVRPNRFIAGTTIALAITAMAAAGFSFGAQPKSDITLDHVPVETTTFVNTPQSATSMVQHAPAEITETAAHADPNIRWYNGRPIRPVRTMIMTTTAYSPDARSCGEYADGITASGYSVLTNGGKLAAADTRVFPFGTMISVPGYDDGNVIPVLDRGGAIKQNRLDLLYPTHEQALVWGVQKLQVTVWEYADGKPNDFKSIYDRKSSVNP